MFRKSKTDMNAVLGIAAFMFMLAIAVLTVLSDLVREKLAAGR